MRVTELVRQGKVVEVVRPGHRLQQHRILPGSQLTQIRVDVSPDRGSVGLERNLCNVVGNVVGVELVTSAALHLQALKPFPMSTAKGR